MPAKEPRSGCILVNKQKEILVVHNVSSDFWGFPKGGKRPYETHLQGALRELHEETGRTLDPSLIIASFESRKSCLYMAVGDFAYECSVDLREIDNYAWVSFDVLKKIKTSKFTQAFFNRIELFLRRHHFQ